MSGWVERSPGKDVNTGDSGCDNFKVEISFSFLFKSIIENDQSKTLGYLLSWYQLFLFREAFLPLVPRMLCGAGWCALMETPRSPGALLQPNVSHGQKAVLFSAFPKQPRWAFFTPFADQIILFLAIYLLLFSG